MGAWVLYGLGSESQNLPGFVVLSSGVGTSGGDIELVQRLSALHLSGRHVPQLRRPDPLPFESAGRHARDAARRARRAARSERGALAPDTGDMEIASRIASYELAFRMQMAAPELLDFSKESPEPRSRCTA